jgi:hypothetical protein
MPGYNSITGQGTPPPPSDSSFAPIEVTVQAELEAPDPDSVWPVDGWETPQTNNNNVFGGGGGGGYTPPTNPTPEPPTAPEVEGLPPPSPASAEPPLVKTGLGEKIDNVINRSPTLRKQWAEAQANGWEIKIGPYGSGSEADPTSKKIYIDEQDLAKGSHDIASLLAHEIGHAARPFPERVDADTKGEYVSTNAQLWMDHEGAAAFENARARDEIMNTDGQTEDGPDIGIRGTFDDKYIAIYERYKAGEISEAQARAEMTEVMSGEPAGIDSKGNYITKREAANQNLSNEWDQQHANTGSNP